MRFCYYCKRESTDGKTHHPDCVTALDNFRESDTRKLGIEGLYDDETTPSYYLHTPTGRLIKHLWGQWSLVDPAEVVRGIEDMNEITRLRRDTTGTCQRDLDRLRACKGLIEVIKRECKL